jgi:hypothetical protein
MDLLLWARPDKERPTVKARLLAPGLAAHNVMQRDGYPQGAWRIVHVRSGMRVACVWRLRAALALAKHLATMIDWSLPGDQIAESPQAKEILFVIQSAVSADQADSLTKP